MVMSPMDIRIRVYDVSMCSISKNSAAQYDDTRKHYMCSWVLFFDLMLSWFYTCGRE